MSCPECCRVKQSQGFCVEVDPTQPLCMSCDEHKKAREWYESPVYQAWLLTIPPKEMSLEARTEWFGKNPPPKKE